MIESSTNKKKLSFYKLKLLEKRLLTPNSFFLSFEIPKHLKNSFKYESGQYSAIKLEGKCKDFSYVSAPFEDELCFGIKLGHQGSFANQLYNKLHEGDFVEISEPQGRFTIKYHPNEKRTILAFASGIGITPIFSHIKSILKKEHLTRIFLFYGNKNETNTAFINELNDLQNSHKNRFNLFFFFSRSKSEKNPLFQGRLDSKKIDLIINQILHLDEDDDESTIWDSTDEILICGQGEMIKSVANACYKNGITKKNIHFELFEEFNDNIYELEENIHEITDINVSFTLNGKTQSHTIKSNKQRILSQLLDSGYSLPYSCKSGTCGSCICKLTNGKVHMLENEYITDKEISLGFILPCISYAITKNLNLDFDQTII